MKKDFMIPLEHVNSGARRLFDDVGEIIDGSIAYINLRGGGPIEQYTHGHNHLFIVAKDEAKVSLDKEEIITRESETLLVEGKTPHSVWSSQDEETVVISISVK